MDVSRTQRRCGRCRSYHSGVVCPLCLSTTASRTKSLPDDYPKAPHWSTKSGRRRWRIAERDGWICRICGKPVRPDAVGVDMGTVDHIIPKSQGGSDRAENLRLAHYRCNHKRGCKPATHDYRDGEMVVVEASQHDRKPIDPLPLPSSYMSGARLKIRAIGITAEDYRRISDLLNSIPTVRWHFALAGGYGTAEQDEGWLAMGVGNDR